MISGPVSLIPARQPDELLRAGQRSLLSLSLCFSSFSFFFFCFYCPVSFFLSGKLILLLASITGLAIVTVVVFDYWVCEKSKEREADKLHTTGRVFISLVFVIVVDCSTGSSFGDLASFSCCQLERAYAVLG